MWHLYCLKWHSARQKKAFKTPKKERFKHQNRPLTFMKNTCKKIYPRRAVVDGVGLENSHSVVIRPGSATWGPFHKTLMPIMAF